MEGSHDEDLHSQENIPKWWETGVNDHFYGHLDYIDRLYHISVDPLDQTV
jgi:hypothetical protein